MPTPQRWNSIRCKVMRIFSGPIPAIRSPDGYGPSSPRGARRLPGFAPIAPTRHRPIGLTCGAIRGGPMPATLAAGSPFLPLRSSRRRHLRCMITMCRRHHRTRSSIWIVRCWCSAILISALSRHRHRRCFFCRRRRRISSSWRRRSHRSGCSSCRSRSSCRSLSMSGRLFMSRLRRTTSSSTTSTTPPSSTTSSISRPSRGRLPRELALRKLAPRRARRGRVAQLQPRRLRPCRLRWRKGPR